MPSNKPRINLTVSQQRYDLLKRLAELQGRSMTAVVNEVLDQVEPVLERVVVVLEAASKAEDEARTGLKESAEKAERDLAPVIEQALSQFDMFLQEAQDQTGSDPHSSNHGGQDSHDPHEDGKSGS